jgi:tRNA(fMet)-specific endonuclease VapC
MTVWLLDTNAISAAVHQKSSNFDNRLAQIGPDPLRISAISYGEIRFGLAQKPRATRLARNIDDFLREISVLPWTNLTAETYGNLRAEMKKIGKSLAPLDLLIAAHAIESGAVLVTNDSAFRHVPGLEVEDWTAE